MASKENLNPLARQWATETRNIILLFGDDLNLDTIAAKQSGGCTVNIQSIGKKAELVFQDLVRAIQ